MPEGEEGRESPPSALERHARLSEEKLYGPRRKTQKVVKSGLYVCIGTIALILLCGASPALAYGSSSEDLVGAFSLQKTIKLASSSQCFSPQDAGDPLSPPPMRDEGPLADDQPPSLAGFAIGKAELLADKGIGVNLTAHIIDDQSGLWAAAAGFASPSQNRTALVLISSQNLTSGSLKDGIYSSRMLIPGYCERGEWSLQNLTLVDREGNRRVMQGGDLVQMGFSDHLLAA